MSIPPLSMREHPVCGGGVPTQRRSIYPPGFVDHPQVCPTCGATVDVRRISVEAIARELGPSWGMVSAMAVDATTGLLATDPTRLDSVRGSEHAWAEFQGASTSTVGSTPAGRPVTGMWP
ncbi:hypothetical protein ACH47B_28785 [Rhodococcus sp. NPDC019627]|uniref:hypothetical protein n=1 Tax=unclassified Rhodococcus (in: high G+C Gram-positive bacteria) TaxID=192944 RepID=UPI0037AB79D3